MSNRQLQIGDTILLSYKGGRPVLGEIVKIDNDYWDLKLKADYFGKNETWEVGHIKQIHINEAKWIQHVTDREKANDE